MEEKETRFEILEPKIEVIKGYKQCSCPECGEITEIFNVNGTFHYCRNCKQRLF